MKVLNLTTYDEECGVAKFQANIQEAFSGIEGIESVIYPISLNQIKKLNTEERKAELEKISNSAKEYDVVHIQHEFGLFYNLGEGFGEIVSVLKSKNIKVVVTIHTAPSHIFSHNPRPPIYKLKSLVRYAHRGLRNRQLRKGLLDPFRDVDAIVTLNRNTKKELIKIVNVTEASILATIHPVKNNEFTKNKSKRAFADKTSKILVVNGFLNPHKGFDKAIKSLMYLPQNYKLLIAGGVNPDSGNSQYMDEICDLIVQLGLTERVRITGYVKDDDELESIIGSCDVALYPYDVNYYRHVSSGAIGVAINTELQIVTYPADSFKEINEYMPGVINVTSSASYFELAQEVKNILNNPKPNNIKEFKQKNSYLVFAQKIVNLYEKILKV